MVLNNYITKIDATAFMIAKPANDTADAELPPSVGGSVGGSVGELVVVPCVGLLVVVAGVGSLVATGAIVGLSSVSGSSTIASHPFVECNGSTVNDSQAGLRK